MTTPAHPRREPDAAGLEAIAERAAKATPGPWSVWSNTDGGLDVLSESELPYLPLLGFYGRGGYNEVTPMEKADAEFVAHARTDVDVLIDLARRQHAALAWIEANRTGPCLFCEAELFHPHAVGCALFALLREPEGAAGEQHGEGR